MHDPAQSAVTALTGSSTETVGQFTYTVPTDTWWWSTSLYRMHGFTTGEIVPTTALMVAHQHPDDRAGAVELITAKVTAGQPFCSRHRILDAQQRIHTVVTVGEGLLDADGHVLQVRGYVIDVSKSLQQDLGTATRAAVELSASGRAAIEQAKGALMITYGLDEAEAFALLRCHSQNTNIKLRDLAAGITDRIGDPGMDGLTADRKISAILTGLAADASTPTGPAANTIESSGGGDERISA